MNLHYDISGNIRQYLVAGYWVRTPLSLDQNRQIVGFLSGRSCTRWSGAWLGWRSRGLQLGTLGFGCRLHACGQRARHGLREGWEVGSIERSVSLRKHCAQHRHLTLATGILLKCEGLG